MLIDPKWFWAKVDQRGSDDCWPWRGEKTTHGYGRVRIPKTKRKSTGAHRVAYDLSNDEPLGARIGRHKCDNPPCCNPRHIEPGTHKDNTRDCTERGRARRLKKVEGDDLRKLRRLYGAGVSPVRLGEMFSIAPGHAVRLGCGVSQKTDPSPIVLPGWRRAGFKHPGTILSDQQVDEIRELYATGNHTQRKLSARYGVSQTQVCNIILRKDRNKKC